MRRLILVIIFISLSLQAKEIYATFNIEALKMHS